jgi:hypothetical protein
LNFGKKQIQKKKQIQNVKFWREKSLESESVVDGNSSPHAAAAAAVGCFRCVIFEQLEKAAADKKAKQTITPRTLYYYVQPATRPKLDQSD